MTERSRLVAGVDGCPAGWVAAIGPADGAVWIAVAATLEELIERHPAVAYWSVDMPIGLAEDGRRACDRLAQDRLGPRRRASVFAAPPRLVVEAASFSYEDACQLAAAVSGKKTSRQSWHLTPKIREVRELLIRQPRWRRRVFESHPELAFAHLAGGQPLVASKKTPAGQSQRETLLTKRFGADAVQRAIRQSTATRGLAIDDTLDALACWTVAERRLHDEHDTIPSKPPADADGLPIVIVA